MSANGPDHLEFSGKDPKECEKFIAAVNKYARAEGKLGDDQWIADLVATCVAGDALLWWSALDEETQGSWKLLRSAMLSRYRLLFAGRSGAEAEGFVHWIRQRALDVGKLDDVHWAAKLASGCFVGSALRWYISLESGVRDDWVALQRAIFAKYGQEFEEGSSIIPLPASAAIAPVTPATAPTANNGRRRGRIKVFRDGDSEIYYLSKDSGQFSGRLYATTSVADALAVETECLGASDGPQNLLIPDNQIQGFDVLGLKWYSGDRNLHYNHMGICGVNSNSGATTLSWQFEGPTLTKPWKISQSDDHPISISALDTSGSGEHLHIFSNTAQRLVYCRLKRYDGDLESKLLFEPI